VNRSPSLFVHMTPAYTANASQSAWWICWSCTNVKSGFLCFGDQSQHTHRTSNTRVGLSCKMGAVTDERWHAKAAVTTDQGLPDWLAVGVCWWCWLVNLWSKCELVICLFSFWCAVLLCYAWDVLGTPRMCWLSVAESHQPAHVLGVFLGAFFTHFG